MIKLFVVLVATAVLAGGGFVAWQHVHPSTGVDPNSSGTATVERGTVIQSVQSTGTVASNLDVQIKVRASGEVVQLGPRDRTKQFDVSDTVKKGDLLIAIDPIDEKRAVDQAQVAVDQSEAKLKEAQQNLEVAQEQLVQAKETARANLASAQAQLQDTQAKASRRKEMLSQKLGTQEDFDTAQAAAAQAQAQVDDAQVAMSQLKTQEYQLGIRAQDVKLAEADLRNNQIAQAKANDQLNYCTVTAPIDGVVTALNIEKGTIISSATSVVGGTALLVLSDMSRIYILANVDESEVGNVLPGQDVDITADAFVGRHFAGKVIRIATQGVNVSNVVTFEVKIEVTSKNKGMLKLAMTTNVNIVQARKEGVLLVPVTAVARKDRKETVTVQKSEGVTEDRPVQLGITDGTNYEVLSGLNEGETIVLHKGPGDSRWNGGPRGGRGFGGGR